MNKDLNKELKDISHELNTQDNRCTADPVFLVQQKVRDYGFDSEYCDDFEWVDCEFNKVDDKDLIDSLEKDLDLGEESPDYNKVYYRERWEYIQFFFTEKAADEFIKKNKHRYKDGVLGVYVDCAYRNFEIQSVRKFLINYGKQ